MKLIRRVKKYLINYSLVSRDKEKLGKSVNYNLFLLFPFLYPFIKGRYFPDSSIRFLKFINQQTKKSYKRAVILGNAPSLSELDSDGFSRLVDQNYLTIGLNRSVYSFQTEVLLWSDMLTIKDIVLKRRVKKNDCSVIHVELERNYEVAAKDDKKFLILIDYWKDNKNFSAWEKDKLYMFRNILIPALHLCYKLNIKEVMLVGFGFDNREYFYKTKKYKNKESYEIRTNRLRRVLVVMILKRL